MYIGLAYYFVVKPVLKRILVTEQGSRIQKSFIHPLQQKLKDVLEYRYTSLIIIAVFIIILKIFIFIDTSGEPRRLVSYLGIWILVLLGLIFSKHPGEKSEDFIASKNKICEILGFIVWRHVLWGLGLQFIMGLLILRWSVGKAVFDCIGNKVKIFLDYTDVGSGFVFGYLVTQKPFYPAALTNATAKLVAEDINNSGGIGFVFMFKADM